MLSPKKYITPTEHSLLPILGSLQQELDSLACSQLRLFARASVTYSRRAGIAMKAIHVLG